MNSDCVDVMIDLETLGTKPGCVILSIGATTFGAPLGESRATFYSTAQFRTQHNLIAEESTLDWWDKQDPITKKEAFSGTKHLSMVLDEFALYLGQLGKPPRVWGNAASFDISILEAAYIAYKLDVPWKYYNVMCFRTLKNLFPQIPVPPERADAHHALADAIYQAAHAEAILEKLRCQSD